VGRTRTPDFLHPGQFDVEYMLVEKEEGRPRSEARSRKVSEANSEALARPAAEDEDTGSSDP